MSGNSQHQGMKDGLSMFMRFGDISILRSTEGGGFLNGGGFVSNAVWVDDFDSMNHALKGAALKEQGQMHHNVHDACFRVVPKHSSRAKKVWWASKPCAVAVCAPTHLATRVRTCLLICLFFIRLQSTPLFSIRRRLFARKWWMSKARGSTTSTSRHPPATPPPPCAFEDPPTL